MGANLREVLGHNESHDAQICGCSCRTTAFISWRMGCAGGAKKEAFRGGAYPQRASARILAFSTCMRPPIPTETLRAGQLEHAGAVCKRVAETVSMHDGRHPCAGLKNQYGAGRLSGCRHCSLRGDMPESTRTALYRRVVCGMMNKKKGRRPPYVQTYPCLSAHQRRAEDPH